MRPALRLGLLPIWRDRDTVQIGIDPRRAVAISGMSTACEVIRLLDGSRQREQILTEAQARGVPEGVTERVLTLLAAAGVLIDFPAGPLRAMPPELRQQLLPLLATASLCSQDGDGGARLLARRSATTVEVRGSGQVAATVSDLLTRSGLVTRPPAGCATEPASSRRPRQAPPDLIVLVGHQSPSQTVDLLRLPVPHLAVCAEEAIGVVGPLVLPGVTACLRCLDLTRTGSDPAWPLILAQRAQRSADPPACDAVLTAAVAAQAAAQVLAFADHAASERPGSAQAAANGTLELVLPSWQWRRRSWLPHPACICGSRSAAA